MPLFRVDPLFDRVPLDFEDLPDLPDLPDFDLVDFPVPDVPGWVAGAG